MAWPLIAVAAASAVYSGVSASNTSAANAKAAQSAAASNANSVINQSNTNNQANSMIAMFNAQSQINAAEVQTGAVQQIADYNSLLLQSTNMYNQELLADELNQIYENEGLDKVYLEQRRSTASGEVIAKQASSGTTIGVGSNQDTYVDLQAQFEMEKAVLVHQYDRQANAVLNAQAQGNYQTKQQIQKLQFEAQTNNFAVMTNAYTAARSGLASSMISSWANSQNASNQANTLTMGGSAQATAYNNQASQQMTSGIVSGIGSAASMYAQTYSPSPATTTTAPAATTAPVSRATYPSTIGSLLA